MPHKPQNNQSLTKAFDHQRNKYREKPKKSFYPFGRKKGVDLIASDDYREGWDRIFGKWKGGNHGQKRQEENQEGLLEAEAASARAAEPSDFDAPTEKKGKK